MREALTFDDVFIVPQFSEVESRSTVDLTTNLTRNFHIEIPIISAPMDSVTGPSMAYQLEQEGAVGALHRFCSIEENVDMVKLLWQDNCEPIVASIGVNESDKERAEALLEAGANILLIDVAHGDHIKMKNILLWLNQYKTHNVEFNVIAGNIATADAAKRLQDWGADALRVGIGGGSMCTTRVRTGVGIPQFTAIQDVAEVAEVPVIADGGIRSSGDAAKALAAGADTVMLGSILAGTDEAPGSLFVTGEWPNEKKMKIYRGSASMTTKLDTKGSADHVEGTAQLVNVKGPVKDVIKMMTDGIRSSMSYVGATNLQEFREKAKFVKVTNAGLIEATPHGLR